jgi:CRISPR-associated protein Cas2
VRQMSERRLYLAAYDIRSPQRLAAMMEVVRAHATGGQKSVYECFLTPAERAELLLSAAQVMDEREDRFFVVRLDPRMPIRTLGVAVAPIDPPFFYEG